MAQPNVRQRVIDWRNPVQDIAFWVRIDRKQERYADVQYGKTYLEVCGVDDGYGSYRLCHRIAEAPEDNNSMERWFFVLDFKDQHTYNYEITQVGTLKWPSVRQTFLIPRKEWQGLDMVVSAPPTFGQSWVRMRAFQERTPTDLDGLFIAFSVEWDDHTYDYPEFAVDDQYEIPIQTRFSIVDSESIPEGPANQNYIGNNKSVRESLEIDTDALDNYFRGLYTDLPSSALMLPDVLDGVTIQWNTSEGNGSFSTEWNGSASGTSYSLSGSESGSAEGSASVVPEITFNITQFYVARLRAMRYTFFLPYVANEITDAAILAKLPPGTLVWPVFKPQSHVISLQGGSISVQARASASAGVAWSASTSSQELTEGEGESQSRSVTMNSRIIPPTIHGLINFTGGATDSVSAAATAAVGWTGTGSPVPLPSANASSSISENLTGRVSPSSLGATSPSSIPTSGNYWVSTNVSNWRYNYALVEAIVFDASQLA